MIVWFIMLSVILMLTGHILKVFRWSEFVGVYEHPSKTSLFYALACGHILNAIFPLRIGDFVRAWLAGRKMNNGMTLSAATVIVDLYLDIMTVCCFFMGFSIFGKTNASVKTITTWYGMVFWFLLIISIICFFGSDRLKKLIQKVSALFNDTIELGILYVSWSIISSLKDIIRKLNKVKLLVLTAGMWICYMCSYYFFTVCLNKLGIEKNFFEVFSTLFSDDLFTLWWLGRGRQEIYFSCIVLLYLLCPLLIIMVYARVKKRWGGAGDNNEKSKTDFRRILPHLNATERLAFLENYFSGSGKEYLDTYLKMNGEVAVVRDYSAGSNATTILCIANEKTFYRKYTIGIDKEKLCEQIEWIKRNKDRLPLPRITREEVGENFCCYDMEYNSSAVPFFQIIHSVPVEDSWNILKNALESLESSLYHETKKNIDMLRVDEYIEKKIYKNLKVIQEDVKCIKALCDGPDLIINGVKYKNLSYYKPWFEKEYLKKIFSVDKCCEIHGDLTIENIICRQDRMGEFYFIDPNTGNIHETSALDYAKLLQSLHGGYEFLMAVSNYEIKENEVSFFSTKSYVYEQLYRNYRDYLFEHMTIPEVKSIYMHEVVHFLRLLPYKIQKDGKKSGIFYAEMIMILNDMRNLFDWSDVGEER